MDPNVVFAASEGHYSRSSRVNEVTRSSWAEHNAFSATEPEEWKREQMSSGWHLGTNDKYMWFDFWVFWRTSRRGQLPIQILTSEIENPP